MSNSITTNLGQAIVRFVTEFLVKRHKLNEETASLIANYLEAYGYLVNITEADFPWESILRLAMKHLQIDTDEATRGLSSNDFIQYTVANAMRTTRRCGLPDLQALGSTRDQWLRRKAAEGLRFAVYQYLPSLSRSDQDTWLAWAWKQWSNVCGIRVEQVQASGTQQGEGIDILIGCGSSANEQFGRPGSVLAWAYKPQGDRHTRQLLMKYDIAERWTTKFSSPGVHYGLTTLHEFGHLLGLDHTTTPNQVMGAVYNESVRSLQEEYDIAEARARYGESLTPPAPPESPSPQPPGNPNPVPVVIQGELTINGIRHRLVPVVA